MEVAKENLLRIRCGFLSLTVGILIFEQVEILDVAGPFEVFSVTRLNDNHRWEESSPFRVLLVSEKMDQVLAYGLRLTPDVTTDNCPKLDLLIVPGGWGTRMEVRNNNLLEWIAVRAAKTRLTASVYRFESSWKSWLIGRTRSNIALACF